MNGRIFRISVTAAALVAAAVLSACADSKPRAAPPSVGMQARISANTPEILRNTVGEFAAFVDGAPTRVEGWGIVANLAHTGSGDADPKIREYLINELALKGVGLYSTETQDISPEAILASDQVSVVEVRGVIPPLARKGTTFDLYVNALPNSGTTSLANGLLWPGDLKQVGLTLADNDTRTIAVGRGPVFIPGALDVAAGSAPASAAGTSRELRAGRVLAGGVCSEDRGARLQVFVPDFNRTMLIERSINSKFPGREKVADAQDQSVILLHVPPEYAENPMDFIELARHIYLLGDVPGFNQDKAREIIAQLADPSTPHRDLGLALQGLGRSILQDYIEPNYTSPNPDVRFWCARAGACMQDVGGMAVLEEFVKDAASPLRRQAMMAMIEASRGRDTTQATAAMMEMLQSFNTDDRILAYHALLAIRSRAVASYSVGKKFMIDVVPADCPPLIYVLESEAPRIAFIGRPLELAPGALYISPDKYLTVSADMKTTAAPAGGSAPVLTAASMEPQVPLAGAAAKPKEKETVTLFWRSPLGGHTAEIRTVARIPDIVARATWVPEPDPQHPYTNDPSQPFIGASYQRITEMLAEMCADKTLDATFITQKAPEAVVNPTDLALTGRPDGSVRVAPASQPAPASAPAPAIPDSAVPQAGAPARP